MRGTLSRDKIFWILHHQDAMKHTAELKNKNPKVLKANPILITLLM